MKTVFLFLVIFFNISQIQCPIPSCKTNCTTNGECWQATLAYHASELIEQLFSFSSLSVHVDTYQRQHTTEVNDSILFIDKALENHLLNESIDSNLPIQLFAQTKQILIEFCKNLTSTPVEGIGQLPSLICSASTCAADTMNFLVLLIISICITSLVLLICMVQSFRTHRQAKPFKTMLLANSYSESNLSVNFRSNRF